MVSFERREGERNATKGTHRQKLPLLEIVNSIDDLSWLVEVLVVCCWSIQKKILCDHERKQERVSFDSQVKQESRRKGQAHLEASSLPLPSPDKPRAACKRRGNSSLLNSWRRLSTSRADTSWCWLQRWLLTARRRCERICPSNRHDAKVSSVRRKSGRGDSRISTSCCCASSERYQRLPG